MHVLPHTGSVSLKASLRLRRTLLRALAAGFVLVSLAVLGVRTLVPPDEGRYAEMAREMFVSKDWITLRLNGIRYAEKPPLQTWMTALSFALFGVGEWQARLWTGLSGLAGVAITGWTGRRLYGPRVGLYAAAVLGSSLYWVVASQAASLDMGLTAMTTLALCGFLLARHEAAPARQRRWMLVCWAAMALAVLSKGLIGIVLPAGALACYTLATRDCEPWERLYAGAGLPLFLAIAAPWFVLAALDNPAHPHFFFVHEHVERFLLKGHRREAPWWTFSALLAAGSLPWLAMLPRSLLAATRRRAGRFQPDRLLLAWVVFILAFFSASSSQLPGYILPVFPAVALLLARSLAEARRRQLLACAALACALGLALLALHFLAGRLGTRPGEAVAHAASQPWILAAGLAALAGGAFGLHCALRMRRDALVLALALAGFASTQLLLAGYEPIGRARAGVDLLPAVRAQLRPDTVVYAVGGYEQSLTFYLGRPVVLVAYRDEFDFGLRLEPGLAIASLAEFEGRWRAATAGGRHALAIVPAGVLPALQRRQLLLRIVASDERRAIVANR